MMIAHFFTVTAVIFCILSHAPVETQAFHAAPVVTRRNSATTELAATNPGSQRREIFGWIKRAAVVGLAFKTASTVPRAVVAEDAAGRIITFNVNNLNGEAGKTGTYKIQLVNEWAPRGAARFEVRSERIVDGFPACGWMDGKQKAFEASP